MTVKSSWKLCLILLGWLFTYNHSLLAQSIEWSRSPAYLTPAQVHDDLVAAKQLIQENYVHYERLQQTGHDWDQVFSELRSQLLENPRPMLTQHFQEKLLDALQFTEDPVFRADLHLPRRHYQTRIPLVEPWFTDLRLAEQGDRFRVLPDQKFPGKDDVLAQIHFPSNIKERLPIIIHQHGSTRDGLKFKKWGGKTDEWGKRLIDKATERGYAVALLDTFYKRNVEPVSYTHLTLPTSDLV